MNEPFSDIYEGTMTVRTYDTDRFDTVRLSYFFQMMQEYAALHSRPFGLTIPDLIKRELTWMIIRQKVRIHRFPTWPERISMETWISDNSRMVTPRVFRGTDSSGELVFEGRADWCVLDLKRRRPVPISVAAAYSGISSTVKQAMGPIGKPAKTPVDYTDLYRYEPLLLYRDTDLNGHVNNSIYCDWCLESLPAAFRNIHNPSCFAIHYTKETYDSDSVEVRTYRLEDSSTFQHEIYASGTGAPRLVCTALSSWQPRSELL